MREVKPDLTPGGGDVAGPGDARPASAGRIDGDCTGRPAAEDSAAADCKATLEFSDLVSGLVGLSDLDWASSSTRSDSVSNADTS